MDTWLRFLGRLHPLILHVPIGALVLLVAAELWTLRARARRLESSARTFLCGATALAALTSVVTGWLLGDEQQSSGTTFERHRALGIAFAACVTLAALCAMIGRHRAYGALLAIGAILLVPLGHFGAEMTHGAGFLLEPFAAQPISEQAVDGPASRSEYEAVIAPILEARCTRCHGGEKRKGGLVLHEPAGLSTAGESGRPPVVAADPAASEIVRRMRLPLDDDAHMPPASKSQPTPEEIDAIERWIAEGASFDALRSTATDVVAEPEETAPPEREFPRREPPADAIAALRAAFVHVEAIDPADGSLWIDFRPLPSATDDIARDLLSPLLPFVVELGLARTSVGDGLLSLVAGMPRLERLDLTGTACSSAGIATLRDLPRLRALNLTATRVDDAVLDTLAALPAAERVYVAHTDLTPDALASFATRVPGLTIETGDD